MSTAMRQTHLQYYKQHNIAPVKYDLNDLDAHLERRESLYSILGLLPLAFCGSKVLEVAAGTGHNSLYIAQALPSKLVLLEPNPTAVAHINQTYQGFDRIHTKPELITQMLEDFDYEDQFNIVICENWLGVSSHELSLLDKLTNYIAEKGVLVLTTVSPIGLIPNVLRRFFSNYVSSVHEDFDVRARMLHAAFATHLDTLSAMTRSKIDWIHDNMMNPAYFNLCLSIPRLLDRVGHKLDVIGTSPAYAEDWRWFKSLCGNNKNNNQHFIGEYWKKAHNFLDHNEEPYTSITANNFAYEAAALDLLSAVSENEDDLIKRHDGSDSLNNVRKSFDRFMGLIPDTQLIAKRALLEASVLFDRLAVLAIDDISNMQYFKTLFGRETGYVSLIRKC